MSDSNGVPQLIHCVDQSSFELDAGQGRYGDRYFLETFFAPPGSNNDVINRLHTIVRLVDLISVGRRIQKQQ